MVYTNKVKTIPDLKQTIASEVNATTTTTTTTTTPTTIITKPEPRQRTEARVRKTEKQTQ